MLCNDMICVSFCRHCSTYGKCVTIHHWY